MLEEDTSVDDSRKYLVFVSDGITYLFDDGNGNPTSIVTEQYYYESSKIVYTPSDTMTGSLMKYPTGIDFIENAGGVEAYISKISDLINADGTKYWVDYGTTFSKTEPKEFIDKDVDGNLCYTEYNTSYGQSLKSNRNEANAVTLSEEDFAKYVGNDDVDEHANNVDTALYLTYQAYQQAASKYHCYAIKATSEYSSSYPWADTFMIYLSGGNTDIQELFANIYNDILYLVDAGSYVEDYMGYVDGDYDFDFVNDAAALSLQVGDTKYEAVPIDENTYGFVPMESNDSAPYYAYKVTYIKGTQPDEEHFVWDIYVPVTNFEPVQLTYTVKLTNPKTAPGTYGTYDMDGSQEYEGLFTNNTAILTPVDTNGLQGAPEIFNKPTVSYTVAATEESSVPEKPETHENVQTGDDSSLGLYTAIMIGCIGMLSLGLYARQKKQREEN